MKHIIYKEIMKPEKTLGFQVLNVGFRVLFGYQFLGSGRVAKRSGFSPVFGYPNPSLSRDFFN